MRIVLVLISLLCVVPMVACGEEATNDDGGAEVVFEQRTRFYQLVCTCQLPENQQGTVVPPGAACVSDYVGSGPRRTCIVDAVNENWDELRAEAQCLRRVFEDAENCVSSPPGCEGLGICVANISNASAACGTGIDAATSDC